MTFWEVQPAARSGQSVRRALWRNTAATAAAGIRYVAGLGTTRAIAVYSNGTVQVDEVLEARRSHTVTGVASTDVITVGAHQMNVGEAVRFTALTGGSGLVVGQTYYVVTLTATTCQLSATRGGSVLDFTTNITAGTLVYGHIAAEDLLADDWEVVS